MPTLRHSDHLLHCIPCRGRFHLTFSRCRILRVAEVRSVQRIRRVKIGFPHRQQFVVDPSLFTSHQKSEIAREAVRETL
jgi:Trm5-related predicted tRNA methylase